MYSGEPAVTPARAMIETLSVAARTASGLDAGLILAGGGWAVFPVPVAHDPDGCQTCMPVFRRRGSVCAGKHDQGLRALSYRDATLDPGLFVRLATGVCARHGVDEVNVACAPWRCRVPLVGVDLDGPAAIGRFDAQFDAAEWLGVDTRGKGGGRHVHVTGAAAPVNGRNPWGGEYRGDRGHLMLPPSLVEGRRDYYRPRGRWFADVHTAPGLLGTPPEGRSGAGTPRKTAQHPVADAELQDLVNRLSMFPPRPAALRRFRDQLGALRVAGVGERHPTAMRALAHAVLLAHRRELPLRWAVRLVAEAFPVQPGERRDVEAEVLAMLGWVVGQQVAP